MRKILGALLFISLLVLFPFGVRHLIFLKVSQALAAEGTFSYAEEKISTIRFLSYKGPNFFIQELDFVIVPSLTGFRINVVGRGGKIFLNKTEKKGFTLNIPSIIGFIKLDGIDIEAQEGLLKIIARKTTILYEGAIVNIKSENAEVFFSKKGIKGKISGMITPQGSIKSLILTSKKLKLKVNSEGNSVRFFFTLNPSSYISWIKGRIKGRGTLNSGIIEIDASADQLTVYKGKLKGITLHLRRGKNIAYRIETKRGDLILGRNNKVLISNLTWETLRKTLAFPVKTNSIFNGKGNLSLNNLSFHLNQNKGGTLSLQYRSGKLSIRGNSLIVGKNVLSFAYTEGKKQIVDVKVSSEDLSSLMKIARETYYYFLRSSLFTPIVSGRGSLSFHYDIGKNTYKGRGSFLLHKGRFYNYKISNLKARWQDNPQKLELQGDFKGPTGEGKFEGYSAGKILHINYSGWGRMENLLEALEVSTDIKGKIYTEGKIELKNEIPVISGKAWMKKGLLFSLFKFSGQGEYIMNGENFSADFFGKAYGGIFRGSLKTSPNTSLLKVSVEGFQMVKINDNLQGVGFSDVISTTKGEITNTTINLRIDRFGYAEDTKGTLLLNGNYMYSEKGDESLFLTSSLEGKAQCRIIAKGNGKNRIVGEINGSCPRAGELLPWAGSKIKLKVNGNFLWKRKSLDYALSLKGQGPVLTFLSYPQPVENFLMEARIKNGKLNFTIKKGSLGGGMVNGKGRLEFTKPIKIDSMFYLKNCDFYPFKKVQARGSASIYIRSKGERINIGGEMVIDKGEWKREFEEPLEFSSRPAGPLPPWINRVFLRLNILSKEGILLENSWGKLTVFPDIVLLGPAAEPMMSGTISLGEGFIWVSERRFMIKEGKVYLSPGVEFDPYLDIDAEAFIKHYRVEMKIQGLLSHMHISLSSSPPLPTHELFNLLAMGESFQRGIPRGSSTQLTSSSFISQALTSRIGKKAKTFLGLSRLSISPNLVRGTSETSARLTAEKSIGQKLTVVYSTDLSGAKKGIIIIEYKINPSVSLVLTKDEKDNYILDIIYYPAIR